MLRTALGPTIAAWLEDAGIVEVMLNPDGRLWVDRLSGGMIDTGESLAAADGERIVRLVAHHVGDEASLALSRPGRVCDFGGPYYGHPLRSARADHGACDRTAI